MEDTMKRHLLAGMALLALAAPAYAADLPPPILKAPVSSALQCTVAACNGPFVGVTVIGTISNLDIIGQGVSGSFLAGGGDIGINAGWQWWNGSYFAAAEVVGAYAMANPNSPIGPGNSKRFEGGALIELGGGLSAFFPTPGPTPAPSQGPVSLGSFNAILAGHLASPYVALGPWFSTTGKEGAATGVGAKFVLAPGITADLKYLFIKYKSDQINPMTNQTSDNRALFSVSKAL
jgi:outer membrane immunogenic protein